MSSGTATKTILSGNPGYIIFFDDVRVDEFVTDFTVNMGIDNGIGTATVNMAYMPDFDKVIHDNSKNLVDTKVPEVEKEKDKSETVVVQEVTNKGYVYNCSALHVRSGPSTKYAAIGWIHPESKGRGDHNVEILGESNKWYNVKFYHTASKTHRTGWSHSDYIKRTTQSVTKTVVSSATKSKSGGDKKYVKPINLSGSNLNIRSGPSTSYKIITKVKEGGKYEYSEKKDGWYKINVNGTWGWASGTYLKEEVTGTSDGGSDSKQEQGVLLIGDDGIENMTNVRIFVRNMFNDKYYQVFGGNIRSKSSSISGNKNTLSFVAEDYMNWLNRTICPIAVPWDGTLTTGDRLKWKAQGIDLNKVKTVNTVADITFKGKNIAQMWDTVSEQTVKANKIYSNKESVSMWDKPVERVCIMGDIDENLKKAEVIDFMITANAAAVNTVYVFMNEVLKTLLFEFYQDRDEVIRIKPPFWNEHVLKSHVIDSSIILSYTETTNYNNYYTRVIASGGLDKWQENSADSTSNSSVSKSILTPVVAVTSGGITANSGPVVVTSGGTGSTTVATTASTAAQAVVDQCRKLIGWPYVWGGEHPSEGGFDCSGLLTYAAKMAGHPIPGASRHTTKTLINQGSSVAKANLIVGDLVFTSKDHVMIYSGGGKCIEAPQPGLKVREINMRSQYYAGRRIWTGANNPGGSNTEQAVANSGTKPESVGPDTLLEPTYMEKKFGPKVYDVTQPLIKFSTSGATNSSGAYDALAKYARFMINYLISGTSLASVQTLAMPWIRPGFNVWVDPIRVDRVFYVNNVSHFGNSSSCYTTLNLTMGRRREDFLNKKDMVGALKPGKSDDIFVNKLTITPDKFGEVCSYDSVIQKAKSYHLSSDDNFVFESSLNNYHSYLYSEEPLKSSSDHGEAEAPKKEEPKTAQTVTKGEFINLGSSNLNIRSGPGTNHSIIGKGRQGHKVTINGTSGEWYKIDWNGKVAYCHSKYVKKYTETVSSSSSSSASTSLQGTVYNCSALNVRSGPGTNHGVIGGLKSGDTVPIIKKSDGWANINYKGNTNAWASLKYLKEKSEQVKESTTTPGPSHNNEATFKDASYTASDLQNKMTSLY
ncbi:MAG: SH3 domain-containing protein, partial [Paraclostridium sp.]